MNTIYSERNSKAKQVRESYHLLVAITKKINKHYVMMTLLQWWRQYGIECERKQSASRYNYKNDFYRERNTKACWIKENHLLLVKMTHSVYVMNSFLQCNVQ